MKRFLICSLLWLCHASLIPVASAGTVAPSTLGARDFTVFRDELPDAIAPEDLEVVLLSRKSMCVREPVMLWGVRTGWTNTEFDETVCRKLVPLVVAMSQAPLLIREETFADIPASVGAALRQLSTPPQRRYVALVAWHMRAASPYHAVEFEQVVVDRHTGAWLWHAFHREQSFSLNVATSFKEAADTWLNMLQGDLLRTLTDRGRMRQFPGIAGARWVAPAEVTDWLSGPEAGLVFVNNENKERNHFTAPSVAALVRPAGQAEEPYQPWPLGTHRRQFPGLQRTPPLPSRTYAVLALPPGAYDVWFGGDTTLNLAAGEKKVISIETQILQLGDKLTLRSVPWFRDTLPRWSRHAFLAKPRDPEDPETTFSAP